MFQQLLISSRFVPVFIVQFFSALSDNFIKNALVILVLFKLGSEQGAVLVTLAGAALIMPMFILSALAGELADKFDKARVARWIKVAEIPVAAIAGLGFVLNSISLLFLSIVLFGFGAALFGPIKYGILPDHLERRELPAANALVEGATFLAILLGTILGGLAMVEGSDGANVVPSFAIASVILGFAIIGWLSARAIQQTGAAAPELRITKNPVRSTIDRLRELAADRRLWVGGLITSWFWLAGIVALSLLPTLIKGHLGGGKEMITLGLCVFTVGIAFGSYLAARASRQRPNLALVPIGALLMGLFCLDIGWTVLGRTAAENSLGFSNLWQSINGVRVMLDLFGMSAAGGLFIVPAFASVQMWAPADKRARVIAAVNILNATFMTTATLAVAGLQYSGWQSSHLFMALGAANLVAVILVLRAWGRQGVQDVAKFLFKVFYRLEVKGIENLPEDGECAIIAPNHVSLLDGPVMHSIMPSYAAFAIDHGIAQAWWVKPFLPLIKAYTLDPTRPLAARALIKEVKAGQTLVIFPEGRLTVTGGLMKVYDGTAMIADKTDAWIVPVRIDGLERSPWSYMRKSQTKKVWFPKVTVTILPARKLEVDATLRGKARRQTAGLALQDVMVNTAVECANIDKTLFQALLDAKETRDTGKTMLEDPLMTKLSYSRLLTGTQMLARKMKKPLSGSENIGVMLPNTAGVAVTFFALQSLGKVPAMLNYTAGARNILAACKAAEVKVVLTSRSFIDKARLQEVEIALNKKTKLVYLEDIRADITTLDKIRALLGSKKAIVKRRPNDPAAILFTSGSEGTPKGVVLSHRNLLANSIQSLTRIAAHGDDKVFNVLPVFHSFGLTAGLIMPLIGGIPIYLYPSPLHYRIVPELVYQTNATILFGTDTFLNGYARVAHPYDFHSVRMILAGAEAVKQRTREVYMERFGVRILEGYGVTETAPVLAINTPLASKSGTVGRLSPLMEYRLEAVPGIEEGGRLHVRGPNVMLGYLRAENPGVLETLQDGWHDTGDIVEIDDQGYITIKGRAKRFAKIAGEMVSLSAVEALAATLSPTAMSVVISMPDLRKGERLVLVTTDKEITRQRFQQMARAKGASDLMVPADVMVVDHVPVLGSGKADYVAAAELVKAEMAGTTGAAQALAT
jgi:acyl-[acyl-carrier-protein]-phospholipid O-acyltransferase/long-chain-fatty-acid--[acyl-carrier-protein] ligase